MLLICMQMSVTILVIDVSVPIVYCNFSKYVNIVTSIKDRRLCLRMFVFFCLLKLMKHMHTDSDEFFWRARVAKATSLVQLHNIITCR